MTEKKRKQILATLLCATTMATFYGVSPAEAGQTGITIDSITNAVVAADSVTINGVTMSGNALSSTTLTTTGAAKVGSLDAGAGTITTTGAISGATLTTTGNATIGGTLTTTGAATVGSLDAGAGAITTTGAISGGTLTTTGNATVGGTLTATGAATVNNLAIGTTNSGFNADGSLKVLNDKFTVDTSGNTVVAGTLAVAGTTDLAGELKVGTGDAFQVAASGNTTTIGTIIADSDGNSVTLGGTNAIASTGFTVGATGALTANSLAIGTTNSGFNADGSLKVLNDKFTVDINGNTVVAGTLKTAGEATFGTDTNNNTVINKGSIAVQTSAAATDKTTINGGTVTAGTAVNVGANTAITNGQAVFGTGDSKITVSNQKVSIQNGTTASTELGAGTAVYTNASGAKTTIDGNGISSAQGDNQFGFAANTGTVTMATNSGKTTVAGNAINVYTGTSATAATSIVGDTITTGTLKTDKLILGKDDTAGSGHIELGSDGSLKAADGEFAVSDTGVTTIGSGTDYAQIDKSQLKLHTDDNNFTTIAGGDFNSRAVNGDKGNIITSTAAGYKVQLAQTGAETAELNMDNTQIRNSVGSGDAGVGAATLVKKDGVTSVSENGDKKAERKVEALNGITDTVMGTTTTGTTVKTTADGFNVAGVDGDSVNSFDFDTLTGVATFTSEVTPPASTTIQGSKITSTNTAGTGVLDGSGLALTDTAVGSNKATTLGAGTATFTGAAGASSTAGTTTTIDGGTITTDTLKVERIELGENMVDNEGNPMGGNLTISADGSLSAAGGNFTITGGTGADKGALNNKVGDTSFTTSTTGVTASAGSGGAVGKSEVKVDSVTNTVTGANGTSTSTVTDNTVSNSANGASSVITGNGGGSDANITDTVGTTSSVMNGTSITDTVGSASVTTTTDGTVFENTTQNAPFTEGGATTTIINGNTITTGHLTTDQLTITSNNSAGDANSGNLTLAGNGSITGNITDGTANVDYGTTIDGSKLEVNDGAGNITSTATTATGTATNVTDGTNTADSKVSADSILNKVNDNSVKIGTGGITSAIGTDVKTEMTADGIKDTVGTNTSQTIADGSVTTTADGYTSTLDQNGMGVTNGAGNTQITSGDVSIKTDDYDIKLSEVGQQKDIDGELTARDEYKDNQTVVGALNAEAGIRREEVARLDNRIDDTNERLDRVGAMAAAAASLKSMGYDPAAPSEFAIALGTYKGSQAVAVGLFHYPNRDFMLNINYTQSGSERMGGVGATWKFGRKNPDRVLDAQMQERQKKVQIAKEKAEAAQKMAHEASARAAYAAKQAEQARMEAATATRDVEKAYEDKNVYDEYRAKKAQ